MNKKKILYSGEASFSLSGYGYYARNLLQKLYDTGKYEIAEHASYGTIDSGKDTFPWRYYANQVANNHPKYGEYTSNGLNQFGAWRIDAVLRDFKPDIIMEIRDPWVTSHITNSAYRQFFSYIYCPTVDSLPSESQWMRYYLDADKILTYSNFGQKGLKKECSKVNVCGWAPPVADPNIFKPVNNKENHKKSFGLDETSLIITMASRNQVRKLYPNLLQSFKKFLDICEEKNVELGKRTYVMIHSSFPDISGWNFGELLCEYGLSSKVLFTNYCSNCRKFSINFFEDARTVCRQCAQPTCVFPNVGNGLSDEDLAKVYNLSDCYVQVATCEGFSLTTGEALSCGIPAFVTNYSALEDFPEFVEATPIEVETMWRDIGVGADRAYPSNKDLANKLYNYLSQPKQVRLRKEWRTANKYREVYNWEKTSKVWENAIDNMPPPARKWTDPPLNLKTDFLPPKDLTDLEYVEYLFNSVNEAENANGLNATGLAKDMQHGFSTVGKQYGLNEVNRDNLLQVFRNIAANKNNAEQLRVNPNLPQEDFIQYANLRDNARNL